MSQTAAVQSPTPADDAKVIIDGLIAKARAAMETFESADQETVDEAVTALAWSIYKPERARELAETALSRLQDWVAKFDDPARTYPSQPRAKYTHDYGEYDHLARRKEWASAPEAGDEGAGG